MTQEDTYKTITEKAEGIFTDKRSKFIAIAIPVRTLEEVKQHLEVYQKKFYDARHVCYAYMLGHERTNFRANDNENVRQLVGIDLSEDGFSGCA